MQLKTDPWVSRTSALSRLFRLRSRSTRRRHRVWGRLRRARAGGALRWKCASRGAGPRSRREWVEWEHRASRLVSAIADAQITHGVRTLQNKSQGPRMPPFHAPPHDTSPRGAPRARGSRLVDVKFARPPTAWTCDSRTCSSGAHLSPFPNASAYRAQNRCAFLAARGPALTRVRDSPLPVLSLHAAARAPHRVLASLGL
jgi:hypothetical protein